MERSANDITFFSLQIQFDIPHLTVSITFDIVLFLYISFSDWVFTTVILRSEQLDRVNVNIGVIGLINNHNTGNEKFCYKVRPVLHFCDINFTILRSFPSLKAGVTCE